MGAQPVNAALGIRRRYEALDEARTARWRASLFSASGSAQPAVHLSMTTTQHPTTIVPPSYPELASEREERQEHTRDTLVPPADVQLTLELECMGLEPW